MNEISLYGGGSCAENMGFHRFRSDSRAKLFTQRVTSRVREPKPVGKLRARFDAINATELVELAASIPGDLKLTAGGSRTRSAAWRCRPREPVCRQRRASAFRSVPGRAQPGGGVAACGVVTRDIRPRALCSGVPARVLRMRRAGRVWGGAS